MNEAVVCYVTPEWAPSMPGGIGRAVRALAAQSERSIILLDGSRREVSAAKADLPNGVELYSPSELVEDEISGSAFRTESFARSYRLWRALIVLNSRVSIDAIEFVDFDAPGFVAIKAARLRVGPALPKLRVRLHGTVERAAEAEGHRLIRLEDKLRTRMERYALFYAQEIVAPSQGVLEEYRSASVLGAARTSVEALPVEGVGLSWSARSPSTPFRVGCLGKIQPGKGTQTLVEAAIRSMRQKTSHPMEVHLIGADAPGRFAESHRAELMSGIPSDLRTRFTFHDATERQTALRMMAEFDAAVVPSRSETFGLVAHELGVMGIPLALSNLPAFREGFEASASTRSYFPRDDVQALSTIFDDWLESFAQGEWPPQQGTAPNDSLLAPAPAPEAGSGADEQKALHGDTKAGVRSDEDASSIGDAVAAPVWQETEAVAVRTRPLVSVVVPFFEMQNYVEACLDSIETDPYSDKEIIVVDDGSKSHAALETLDALRTRFASDPRRRVLVQENSGLGSARNTGILAAKGEFVLSLDPDDLLVPGYLEAGVSALVNDPDLAYVVGISELFEDGDHTASPLDWIIPYDPTLGMLLCENGAGTSAGIFRRECLLAHPYREDLPAYEDWALNLELASKGRVGEMLPFVGHRYRQRPGGLARLGHRFHDRIVAELRSPYLGEADAAWATALDIHLANEVRLRGLGTGRGMARQVVSDWAERIYRRRLKSALREHLGEARRDQIVRWVRSALRGV